MSIEIIKPAEPESELNGQGAVEKIPEKTPEEQLTDFRGEMRSIRENEEGGELTTGYFTRSSIFGEFNPDALTPEDLRIRQKFGTDYGATELTEEEFKKYHKAVEEENNPSRELFAEFILNKFIIIKIKEHREAHRKEKEQRAA